jgi:hypothetical protein
VSTVEISCVEVWREVSNYLDGDIDPALRRRIEDHFRVCQHCTAVLDGTRNVMKLVGDGRAFDLPNGFGERMRARLMREC